MKKIIILVYVICLSLTIVSCSDRSVDEYKSTMKTNKDETITSQQETTLLKKENNSKVKKYLSKDTLSSLENIELETNIEPESTLIPTSAENVDIYTQEQDTGIPLDPDNENDFYFIPPSSDYIDANEELDTGDFLDADL